MNTCPTCKRRMPTPRTSSDKRLTEDIGKARYSLAVLESVLSNPYYFDIAQAIRDEQSRLVAALSDHRLLWTIYRRNDKSKLGPYYTQETQALAA